MEECCATNAEVVGSNPTGPAIILKVGSVSMDSNHFDNLYKEAYSSLVNAAKDTIYEGPTPTWRVQEKDMSAFISLLYRCYMNPASNVNSILTIDLSLLCLVEDCRDHCMNDNEEYCIKLLYDFIQKGGKLPLMYGCRVVLPPIPLRYIL